MTTEEGLLLRASNLNTAEDCERRAGFRALNPDHEGHAHIGGIVGTMAHRIVEAVVRDESRPEESAAKHLEEEMDRGSVEFDGLTANDGEAIRQARSLAKGIWGFAGATLRKMDVEMELRSPMGIRLGDDREVVLKGTLDYIGGGRILDIKTSRSRRGVFSHAQMGAYHQLASDHDHDVGSIGILYMPRTALKNPQPEPELIGVSVEAARTHSNQMIAGLTDGLKSAITPDRYDYSPFRANPQSMLCSAKWCPLHGTEHCPITEPEKEN